MVPVKKLHSVFVALVLALSMPVVGALVAASSTIAQAAVVNRIEVRGTSRMDAETVKTYLTIEPGKSFGNQDIDDSVKALYATGLFTDVSISQSGSILVVEVDESGIVNAVFFEGNKRLKDEALSGTVQTEARSTYSEEKVLSDVERIREAYARVGREDADVSYEIVPLQNKRVNVVYRIDEGGKTKISRINFVGNSAYGSRRLRDVIETKQTHLFSWLRNDDIYDADKLRADEEKLRRFYYNHGYADFQVLSSDVSFDEAGNQYVITFNVEEGALYTFGAVSIDSTIPEVNADSLYGLIESREGKSYSSEKVEKSIIALSDAVAESGFAFVQVTPRGDRDFNTNTISVTYQIDQGQRVYIQEILIVGNDRTRDHVIRREFDISEGDPLNQVMIQKTKRRLEGLGFFETVDISTRQGNSPDKVVVVVRVVDKATGEFAVGGGYSTSSGPLGEISFSEKNFLGRGQYIKVAAGFGTDNQQYTLSFTEPYFLGYRISAGFDLFTSTAESNDYRTYGKDSLGGTLRFGIPITDKVSSNVYYTFVSEDTVVSSSALEPGSTIDGDAIQGNTAGELSAALARNFSWTKSGFGFSLAYNDLDNQRTPTEGIYLSLSQVFYGAGGDATYSQTEGKAVGYATLSDEYDLIGMVRARGGANLLISGSDGYRTQDNFYQGSKDIRGFQTYGFGPRDPITGDALGGQFYWNATAEVTFPMPALPESMGVRGAFFADVGQLWGLDSASRNAITAVGGNSTQLDDNSLRASVGASLLWASPFGPLRFDYAFPVLKADWDKTREFNFGISTAF